MTAADKFDQIVDQILDAHKDCEVGKMMSSPGLQYKKKNFAFLNKETMGFKLGKEFDIDVQGVKEWSYLSPFKTKPPLYAWYVLDQKEMDHWPRLTELAYSKLKSELG